MPHIITGTYRVRAGQEDEFVRRMERIRELLARRGQGLRYYALTRSLDAPSLFGGVVIWETCDDEQRMVHDPERQALIRELDVYTLLDTPPSLAVGPAILEYAGRGDNE